MNIKQFADTLNNRTYPDFNLTPEEIALCQKNNWLVITGASDDLLEIQGKLQYETDYWSGNTGYIQTTPEIKFKIFRTDKNCIQIKIRQDEIKFKNRWIPWVIETIAPHESFDIMEDGLVFCRGIVLQLPTEFVYDSKSVLEGTAKLVRTYMEHTYGAGTNLCGHCIEAADRIVMTLKLFGIKAKTVEGWCIYEDDSSCSDRCYDEHIWVEADGYYIDVTADQFNPCMIKKLKPVYIVPLKRRPKCMQTKKPEFQWLSER